MIRTRILIAVLVAAFLVPGHSAFAQTATTTNDVFLADATVNLFCEITSRKQTYGFTGSGSFIDSRGVILTNAHVAQFFLLASTTGSVTGKCTVRTGSPARNRYTASLLYLSPEWVSENIASQRAKHPRGTGEGDYALLYVTGTTKGSLPDSFPALSIDEALLSDDNVGETFVASGYPAENLSYKRMVSKLMAVRAPSELEDVDSYSSDNASDFMGLSGSYAAQFGVSGGPVVNEDNEIVGVASAITSARKKEDRTLRAITIDHIKRDLIADTGSTLSIMVNGDYAAQSAATYASFSPELKKSLSDSIFKKKKR